MVSRIDKVIKVELEKIMRESQSLKNKEFSFKANQPVAETLSDIDNLINDFGELFTKDQQAFFQNWIASELPLDQELTLQLIKFISENPDSNIKRLIITSANFLSSNNLSVKNFFLKILSYEDQLIENFNINSLSDLIEFLNKGGFSDIITHSNKISSAIGIALLNQISNLSKDNALDSMINQIIELEIEQNLLNDNKIFAENSSNKNYLAIDSFADDFREISIGNQSTDNFNINNLSELIKTLNKGGFSYTFSKSNSLSSAIGIALLNQVSKLIKEDIMAARINQVIKFELEKIIQDNHSFINDNLSIKADQESPELSSALDNLINSFGELSTENQTLFFQSWLASELPLDPELVVPLIEFISENSDSNLQRLLIKAAAFLDRNNLPVRKFFLEALSYENQFPDNFNINNFSEFIEFLTESDFTSLFAESDNLSSAASLTMLNQVSNLSENQQLLLYIELPLFINDEKNTPDKLYLRVTRDAKADKNKENKSYQLSFIIDLSEKSTVKADINILNKKIKANFITTSANLKESIDNNLETLKDNIARSNYNLVTIETKTIDEINNLELREEIITETIDIKDDLSIKEVIDKYRHIDIKA
ncbi:hypothetical protein I0Q91_13690 [Halanaerobiaceae bacterium Z-7014]|uniref:Flagellar hook-length control protein FliK n=1 Tax=Halonatronomonas betaini TaxID=2778430 RepID=A0A931AX62_9FIRM|nr:hypothetical protein [Halonatronomonas betaini]MBF8438140.1 hypothetical protein [Halonatronomonas betaini]